MNCLFCGKKVGKNRYGIQKKFCSQKCNSAYQYLKSKQPKGNNICPYCGGKCLEEYCNELHKKWHNSVLAVENNRITFKPPCEPV